MASNANVDNSMADDDHGHDVVMDLPTSEVIQNHELPGRRVRSGSTASRVSLDHFDPRGVHELARTLSHLSNAAASQHSQHGESEADSQSTANWKPDDPESFDLEKHLKHLVRRYVLLRHSDVVLSNFSTCE